MSNPYRIALAAALVVLALAVVAHWKIGPVVAVLTSTHGVHAGDALAALPGLAAVWLVDRPLRPRLARAGWASPGRAGGLAA